MMKVDIGESQPASVLRFYCCDLSRTASCNSQASRTARREGRWLRSSHGRWKSLGTIDGLGGKINAVSSASELLRGVQKEEDPKLGLQRIHVADRVLWIVNEAIRNEVIVARKIQNPPRSQPQSTSTLINGLNKPETIKR